MTLILVVAAVEVRVIMAAAAVKQVRLALAVKEVEVAVAEQILFLERTKPIRKAVLLPPL